jgi:VWFA-related protein
MKITRWAYIPTALIILASLCLRSAPAFAQAGELKLKIETIKHSTFPAMETYVSVTDSQGFPILGLQKKDFSLAEDGNPVMDFIVTPFQNTSQPLAFVLLIDTSGSMASQPIRDASGAAYKLIDSLATQDGVAVVTFSDVPKLVQPFTTDKSAAKTAMQGMQGVGNTTLYDAIVMGVEQIKQRSERKVIILLTDGKDTGGKYNFDQAVNEAVRWSIPIYPVGFGNVDAEELEKLAQLTGGSLQIEPDSNTLDEAFTRILQVFREQYRITFTSALAADNNEHSLNVKVDYQNWHDEVTQSFNPVPGKMTLTFPGFQDGQIVGGRIFFKPEIISPGAPTKLEILLNGALLTTDFTAPFEYEWDSTTVAPGLHQFTFMAEDSSGASAQVKLTLQIAPPILVQITAPIEKQVLLGKTTIQVEVAALAPVASVIFYTDDTLLQTITSAPYQAVWNLRGVNAGEHKIRVVAKDANGFEHEQTIAVMVELQNNSGIVWIVAIAALSSAAVIIPLAIRRRKTISTVEPTDIRPGQLVLRELEGLHPGKLYTLSSAEIRLGRKRDENDIHLKGLKASRRHAMIRNQGGQYVLYCLNPVNPVYINHQPVHQQQALKPGDVIHAGESEFRFEQVSHAKL